MVIEMCAYLTGHLTDEQPWRCVVCEDLTRHSEDQIMPHLMEAHGLDKTRLKTERGDAVFLYPAKGVA